MFSLVKKETGLDDLKVPNSFTGLNTFPLQMEKMTVKQCLNFFLEITQNNPSSFYLSSPVLFSIPLIFLLIFYGPAPTSPNPSLYRKYLREYEIS